MPSCREQVKGFDADILLGLDAKRLLLQIMPISFNGHILGGVGTDGVAAEFLLPFFTIPLFPFFLDRHRYKTPAQGLELPVKPDPLLVQKEIFSSQSEHRQSRIFRLPGIIAPQIPHLVGKIVIHGPTGGHNQLVKIGDQFLVQNGIVPGETVEDSELDAGDFFFAVLPVSFLCVFQKGRLYLQSIGHLIGHWALGPVPFVGGLHIGHLPHDLPAGIPVQMGQPHLFPDPSADDGGLGMLKHFKDSVCMAQAANQEDLFPGFVQFLKVLGHGFFPQNVLG